ncbi:GGDEF domain-containing protein [Inhella gelatinilytica]|uniref:diguanylate cyclase n=1 Tax=Inhella gelatinilytica TaxID=2795030 RepID=A0A931ND28_9BURK|nr:GGDEF domain-containing protein [Inhella gelatinilytica]MBH9551810.1 GGDEF domain-containing protein [Inhella gelatinilytica]
MGLEGLLTQVLALLSSVAAVLWAVLAGGMRVSPRASGLFSAANGLLGLSLLLTLQRDTAPDWVVWPVADLLGLSAYALSRRGVQHLFKLPHSTRIDLMVWSAVALGYAVLPLGSVSVRGYTLLYSLPAAFWLGALAWELGRALQAQEPRALGLPLAAPFALAAAVMLARTGWLLDPEATATPDPLAPLWAFVCLVIFLNVSLATCVVARLLQIIRRQALIDPLTGVANRRHFNEQLALALARQRRNGQPLCLMLLDLDHFKPLNDRHGHAAGDAALVQVAQRLKASLREVDLAARIGGEEFALLLPDTPLAQALEVAQRLRQTLRATPPQWDGQALVVTVSGGVVQAQGNSSAEGLLQAADAALYRAKGEGRDRVVAG